LAEWESVWVPKYHEKDPVNQEITIQLRNPETFEMINARAIIRTSFEAYPNADRLFYSSATAGRDKEPVPIEILEILPEKEEEVTALPKGRPTLGERKGKMLAEMIRERQERKQDKKKK
jgi:hypothetical protein